MEFLRLLKPFLKFFQLGRSLGPRPSWEKDATHGSWCINSGRVDKSRSTPESDAGLPMPTFEDIGDRLSGITGASVPGQPRSLGFTPHKRRTYRPGTCRGVGRLDAGSLLCFCHLIIIPCLSRMSKRMRNPRMEMRGPSKSRGRWVACFPQRSGGKILGKAHTGYGYELEWLDA
jgi:hypothetical protein